MWFTNATIMPNAKHCLTAATLADAGRSHLHLSMTNLSQHPAAMRIYAGIKTLTEDELRSSGVSC